MSHLLLIVIKIDLKEIKFDVFREFLGVDVMLRIWNVYFYKFDVRLNWIKLL